MLYAATGQDGLAWDQASDEAWAGYAEAVYAAALLSGQARPRPGEDESA